jgi:hypothetical protein
MHSDVSFHNFKMKMRMEYNTVTNSIIPTLSFCILKVGKDMGGCMGWDSSVGIVTHYGLDKWGFESWWGPRFSTNIQTSPGAGLFPGGKVVEAWH